MANKNNHLEDIINVAQDLFFNYDYVSVSMSNIAESAKITKAALYYHFKNKQELYLHVLDVNFTSFKEKLTELINSREFINKNIEEKTKQVLRVYIRFIISKASFLKILAKRVTKHDKQIIKIFLQGRKEIVDILEPFTKEIIKYKKGEGKIDEKSMVLFLFSMPNAFIHDFVTGSNKNINVNPIIDKICFLIFNK